jgi:hypothetical protein
MPKIYVAFITLLITLTGCGVNISGAGTDAVLQEYGGSLS